MPSGVYVRQPWMRTYGKTRPHRESILRRLADGVPLRDVAKRFKVSKRTVQQVRDRQWNPGRQGAPEEVPNVLRAHNRRTPA